MPGGFVGDPDVMDTWATSSVTPQIACGWEDDPALFAATFPMDLRPQGPEIIRTWLFSTLLRSHQEHDVLPWRHTTINGWILDPDRKKMSKSKGNVITPMATLEEFGSDAVRYWACNGRPGTDTALDAGVMKIGRRLAIKILNASKFALGRLGESPLPGLDAVHMPLDAALLAQLARSSTRPRRPTTSSTTRAPSSSPRPSSGPSATTTSSWSRPAPTAREERAGPTRPGPRWRWRSRPCTASLPPSCPSSPKRSGAGGRRAPCTGPPGPSRPTRTARRSRPVRADGGVRGPRRGPAGEDRHKRSMRARVALLTSAARPRRSPRSRRPGATSSTPAAWTSWSSRRATRCRCRWSWPTRPDLERQRSE